MVTPVLQSDMYSPTKLREKINKNNSELFVEPISAPEIDNLFQQ